MEEQLRAIAAYIADSALNEWALYLLRNIYGFPPIVQTIHIICVAIIVASIMFMQLRILGWAVPMQQLSEMRQRLLPWFWTALPILIFSGLIFVLARPHRYFLNPVFGIKMATFVFVLATTLFINWRLTRPSNEYSSSLLIKLLALLSLTLWLLAMLAGRWIAYKDYLFPPAY